MNFKTKRMELKFGLPQNSSKVKIPKVKKPKKENKKSIILLFFDK